MRSALYLAGRVLQVLALITMPSAIWIGHIGRNEQGAITIFAGSIAVFFIGYYLTHLSMKL